MVKKKAYGDEGKKQKVVYFANQGATANMVSKTDPALFEAKKAEVTQLSGEVTQVRVGRSEEPRFFSSTVLTSPRSSTPPPPSSTPSPRTRSWMPRSPRPRPRSTP